MGAECRVAGGNRRGAVTLPLLLSLLLVSNCATPARRSGDAPRTDPALAPTVAREFRAAWIASVANINWPSRPGLSTREQQQEALSLLDMLAASNFNAAILQVRPQCDALYASELEPWSCYLTGTTGKAPEPYYDPLEFWVTEAHRRGIELHAWLNPYRAHHVSAGDISEQSVVRTHPELVVRLESGYYWLDPALPETQDYTLAVVRDLVRRYDIDGLHFDDYFYPYPSYNNHKDFPDDASWRAYREHGGRLGRDDWRRDAVDRFIQRVYREIKREKRHVKFGLSPFGIWRPFNPGSIHGLDQYDVLYADARRWFNEGWVDYYAPQLYWPIRQIPQSFPVLLGWWAGQNHQGRHLWPGIRVDDGAPGIDEVLNQIMVTRGMLPASPGATLWSIGALRNADLLEALHTGPYRRPALVPPSPWLDATPPAAPQVSVTRQHDMLEIRWAHPHPRDVFRWVVHHRRGRRWDYTILAGGRRAVSVPLYRLDVNAVRRAGGIERIADLRTVLDVIEEVAVSAVDRLGNVSPLSLMVIDSAQSGFLPARATLRAELAEMAQSAATPGSAQGVRLGIDLLIREHMQLISGRRVGLITHPAAVGADLRSSVDILAHAPGVDLVALFAAENGVRGEREGGAYQAGEIDARTGIPVHDMYGDAWAPRRQWLQDLDVLLFDIPSTGSAWDPSVYAMFGAMRACARLGIPFVVLDRPNPLGGDTVEGPLLTRDSILFQSHAPRPGAHHDPGRGDSSSAILRRHQETTSQVRPDRAVMPLLPLRHGMTSGELATMWNTLEGWNADLTVVRMEGWKRGMMGRDTGLPWVMPTGELGTLETAVACPGQGLFARTNMSVGRGTAKPLLLVGAPWVDADAAAVDLNARGLDGVRFRPVRFIPRLWREAPAREDKPWNRICAGVEILVTDAAVYRSVATSLHILDACVRTNPNAFVRYPPSLLQGLDASGATIRQTMARCDREAGKFARLRAPHLLYP